MSPRSELMEESMRNVYPIKPSNKHYSHNIGIKPPNINFSTAMRSSKRPNYREDEGIRFYNKGK